MRIRALFATLVVTLVALSGTAPAAADPAPWLPPTTLGGSGSVPQVAVSDTGIFAAIWVDGANLAIQASRSTDGVNWSPAANVDPPSVDYKDEPQIAIDSAGVIHAIWARYSGGMWQIYYSNSTDAQAWSTPTLLSSTGQAGAPQFTVEGGKVTAVWTNFIGAAQSIESNYSPDSGATWNGPLVLASVNDYGPQIVTNPTTGFSTVIWTRGTPIPTTLRFASSSDGFATFTTGLVSDPGIGSNTPRLALLGDDVMVAYESFLGTSAQLGLSGGTNWLSTPLGVLGAGTHAQVATTGSSGATVVWTDTNIIQSSTTVDAGDTWTLASAPLSTGGLNDNAQLAIAPDGTIVAVWSNSPTDSVQSAFSLDAGATWSALSTPSSTTPATTRPVIAASPDGRFIVAWGGSSVQVTVSAPVTPAAQLPSTGVQPLGLALGAGLLVGAGMLALGILRTQKRRQTEV